MSGLETITDENAENAATRDALKGIADFMAMMINRSIDFTKVGVLLLHGCCFSLCVNCFCLCICLSLVL